jgi:hypothetical protein
VAAAPVPPPAARALFDAFDRFLQANIALLNDAKLPHPADSLADLLVGGLLAKLLRLADALLALGRGGQARESGPTLRTLLTTYVNLRFLATYERPDEAAAAYVVHSKRTLSELKKHVVREDKPDEGFPTMTEEAWAASSAAFEE